LVKISALKDGLIRTFKVPVGVPAIIIFLIAAVLVAAADEATVLVAPAGQLLTAA
jgi:hypothetical protein